MSDDKVRDALEHAVTVTFTAPQVQVIHAALSMIENDPDWVAMLGGRQQMETLYRAHNRILLARKHATEGSDPE